MTRFAAVSLLIGAALSAQPRQNLRAQSFPSYRSLTHPGTPASTVLPERPFVELLAPISIPGDVRSSSKYRLHPKRDEAGGRFGRASDFVPPWDRGRAPESRPGMVSLLGIETDRSDGTGTLLTRPAAERTTRLNELNEPLPPLEEELWLHGGSYLYAPEGDRLNWPSPEADDSFKRVSAHVIIYV